MACVFTPWCDVLWNEPGTRPEKEGEEEGKEGGEEGGGKGRGGGRGKREGRRREINMQANLCVRPVERVDYRIRKEELVIMDGEEGLMVIAGRRWRVVEWRGMERKEMESLSETGAPHDVMDKACLACKGKSCQTF